MKSPEYPENEKLRQIAVEKYELLDTLPEDAYDHITATVAYICNTPIALITLLDKERNFLKSHYGVAISESPRAISFCGHAINSDAPLTIIEDSRKDKRFIGNPLVTEYDAIFYAGAPLVDSDGFKLGTLCVYDAKPRVLNKEQQKILVCMAKQVVNLFEQRYQNFKLLQYQETLKKRNENLKKFAHIVSHDLKSPLANIISLTELLKEDISDQLNDESLQYLEYLKDSSYALKDYIDGILMFYKSDELISLQTEKIDCVALLDELIKITGADHTVQFSITTEIQELLVNKVALLQILVNLITNSIKYNSKETTSITIAITESSTMYEFMVEDTSDGIPSHHIDKIFELFSVAGAPDKYGNMGTGIGLATVQKIVESLGGTISVSSVEGEGTTFTFSLAKLYTSMLCK